MATKIFISHCMKNIELVNQVKKMLEMKGLNAYVAVSEPEPGQKLNEKIVNHIKSSSYFLLLYTKDAVNSPWVNNELGIAIGLNKKIIPIIEEGVQPPTIISGIEYLKLDSINPETCIQSVCDYLHGLIDSNDDIKIIIAVILILLGIFVLATILSE